MDVRQHLWLFLALSGLWLASVTGQVLETTTDVQQSIGVSTCGLFANLANQLIYGINTNSSLNSGLRSELQAIMARITLLSQSSNPNLAQRNACLQVLKLMNAKNVQALYVNGDSANQQSTSEQSRVTTDAAP